MKNMAKLLTGREVSQSICSDVKKRADKLAGAGIIPALAIVRIGDNPDDVYYEKSAEGKMASLGIACETFAFAADISEDVFKKELASINARSDIHGILVFCPLPRNFDEKSVKNIISPEKDVDGMTDGNMAKVFSGDPDGFAPCTAEAVVRLIKYYGIGLSGKNVVIIGRSMVVGKPLSMLLLKENATVTVCHTKTQDIESIARTADILVAAAGRLGLVDDSYVSGKSIVIDVGMNAGADGKMCGDVAFGPVSEIVSAITPVPGGVGSVTTSVLAEHVVAAAEKCQ